MCTNGTFVVIDFSVRSQGEEIMHKLFSMQCDVSLGNSARKLFFTSNLSLVIGF